MRKFVATKRNKIMQNDKVNFMRKVFIIATFIFIAQITKAQNMHSIEYHNDSIERSKEYKEGNSFQKDFLLFIDMLETTHPAFSIDMSSPFNIDHWIGAAPRYFGSREACTLIQPYLGRSSSSLGNICPKAATTINSGS